MSQRFADIIINISHEDLDRAFSYRIPEELSSEVKVGSVVKVPFGAGGRVRKGYVTGFRDTVDYPLEKVKDILGVDEKSVPVEGRLIRLADWMHRVYGSTMLSALLTVMPVKEKVRDRKVEKDLTELETGAVLVEELTEEQQRIVSDFTAAFDAGDRTPVLLRGVTGSGKTEVYIRMAEEVIRRGRQVIMLVPEIALTYQTTARFRARFGERISILNSRLSKGEKYREFERAKKGETDILIGPRSALFAPFPRTGLILIDEEHDGAYKSEKTPKYHARETAMARASLEDAVLVMGSATPSVESYQRAKEGKIRLYTMENRAVGRSLATVSVADMREELRKGNKSIFSEELLKRMNEAFSAGEQVMLFLNRRGYHSFVSCRSCGEAVKCPHCDVTLSLHGKNLLMCHYCGHTEKMHTKCPKCGSPWIGGYGIGTERVEEEVRKLFPQVRTLRMDKDTTGEKDAHGRILRAFRNKEADCLIGTQMIVKGHDFPNVTVVGCVLADLGLFDSDYRSAERTFDLLMQAAGRAGRGDMPGYAVFQTYKPDHYAVQMAAAQDYEGFFEYEIAYRRLLRFPPVWHLSALLFVSDDEAFLKQETDRIGERLRKELSREMSAQGRSCSGSTDIIGPAEAMIYRVNERYRRVIYLKSADAGILFRAAGLAEKLLGEEGKKKIEFTPDLDPMNIV